MGIRSPVFVFGDSLMTWLYAIGGGIAVFLLIYLVVALLRPEKFS